MRGRWRAQVMAISQLIREEFDGRRDLSGIGGVETGRDAAEFLLLGANSVQVSAGTPSDKALVMQESWFLLLGANSVQACVQEDHLDKALVMQESCSCPWVAVLGACANCTCCGRQACGCGAGGQVNLCME